MAKGTQKWEDVKEIRAKELRESNKRTGLNPDKEEFKRQMVLLEDLEENGSLVWKQKCERTILFTGKRLTPKFSLPPQIKSLSMLRNTNNKTLLGKQAIKKFVLPPNVEFETCYTRGMY